MPTPSNILSNLFENPFSMDHFMSFIGELFNCTSTLKIKGPFPAPTFDGVNYNFAQLLVDQSEVPLHKQIDIVVIEFLDGAKNTIEKARTKQRNIISNHLKTYAKGKNNVLAVFWSKNDESWRRSYVKQDFKVIEENGKKKVTDELSPAKRFSFFIEPSNSRNVTVKKNFIKLLDDKVSPSVTEIEEAFSVEAVTNDFFNNYKLNYQQLLVLFQNDISFQNIQALVNHGDEHFAENFVKKFMGQIVFLYFLQKKGWIGVEKDKLWGSGSHSYMRDLHNECIKGGDPKKENGGVNYFNDYLEHLFYATLNEKRGNHWSDYFNIKIPYLNGGLFEPINGYSWQGPEQIIFKDNEKKANKVFGDLLDFFDQYNFTVYENDPLEQDVAVDPEMLGKIFENLLPENERKGKGSFYTPREIVHYMCKESIKQYLITKTGLTEERIDKLMRLKDSMETTKRFEKKETSSEQYQKYLEFEQDANKIDTALSSVRIIDPAVGSGAFPMGILKEIVTLRTYIKRNILLNNDPDLQYNLKKEALENCIYGVDIDPGAVEIAKLRFWLSLVIENDSQNIETLPNLDYKIMQGNSLVEQLVIGESVIDIITDDDLKDDSKVNKKLANIGGAGLFDSQLESSHLIQKIKFLHKKFFLAKTPEDKKSLKKEIDLIEKSLIRAGCEQEINRIKSQLDNLTLKTTVTGAQLTDKELKLIDKYQQTIVGIKNLEAKFERDNIRPFFPWKLHFGEIFKEQGGFDIVIGNPPYVGEKGNKEIFQEIAKGSLSKFYQGKMDLFYFFFHLAINLGNDYSQTAFITTNYYTTANGAKKLRTDFKNRTIIKKLINFNELKIFESAMGQHNMITILVKGRDENSGSENCVTKRKGYYMDINGGGVLDDIFNGTDKETYYVQTPQKSIYEGEENYIRFHGDKAKNEVLNRLSTISTRLENILNMHMGIQSSADYINSGNIGKIINAMDLGINMGDGIFILTDEEIKKLELQEEEFGVVKKTYKNSGINRRVINKNNLKYHIFSNAIKDEKRFPNIISHLSKFKPILVDRAQFEGHCNNRRELHQPRIYNKPLNQISFEKEKIVISKRSKKNNFAYSDDRYYEQSDIMVMTIKDGIDDINIKYVLSYLNSKLFFFRYSYKGKRKGEMFEFYGKPLSEVPIKKIDKNQQAPFISLVDQILAIKKDDPKADTSELESQIDNLVYHLYELTYNEVKIVDPEFAMSKEEYESFIW